ncbi:ABC transporter permease [Lysinimonas soli]|uniref:ABC transporter permease n=1 Tax=Lysinimonas soli TaxID=1074233 RepID=A0ABW0NS81_9MICO
MTLFETLRSAFRGLTANKLRSALTLLGVMIGVAAVILLLAVGNGSSQQIRNLITQLGTNTITVRAGSGFGFGGGAASADTSTKKLTLSVADRLAAAGLGHVDAVVPQVSTSLTVSTSSATESSISVVGTTPDYFTVTTSKIGAGSPFTVADVTSAAKVAVIGSTLASELFPSGSAIGQTVSVDGTAFTVVGVLASQTSVGIQDPNSVLVAPISRVQRSYTGFGAISSLTVEAISSDAVTAAEGEVQVMLDQLLKYDPTSTTETAPYTISNQTTLLQTAAASAQSFTVLLGAVAAISLLVGGIGVTNVMLVTVTERTREIGIRKALGATRTAILGQFLVEAATLTLLGGVLGVVIALVGAQFPINGTQPEVLSYSIPLALGVSVAIGVFFGVYPAARAAAMRPIQALRSN